MFRFIKHWVLCNVFAKHFYNPVIEIRKTGQSRKQYRYQCCFCEKHTNWMGAQQHRVFKELNDIDWGH